MTKKTWKKYSIVVLAIDILALIAILILDYLDMRKGLGFDPWINLRSFIVLAFFVSMNIFGLANKIKDEFNGYIFWFFFFLKPIIFLIVFCGVLGLLAGLLTFGLMLVANTVQMVGDIKHNRLVDPNKVQVLKNQKQKVEKFKYKGEYFWDGAAKEYRKKNGKKADDQLTPEEEQLIYGYTMMPVVYFFAWMLKNDFLNEETYTAEDKEKVAKHEMTPLELISSDCYLSEEDLKRKILTFARAYTKGDDSQMIDDYTDVLDDPYGYFFCVDFSWEACDKVGAMLDERKKEWDAEKAAARAAAKAKANDKALPH